MLLWVLPLYLLVYLCSIVWFRQIASTGLPLLELSSPAANTSLTRCVMLALERVHGKTLPFKFINEMYRLLTWAIVLAQVRW
jgi:hypothetical protein